MKGRPCNILSLKTHPSIGGKMKKTKWKRPYVRKVQKEQVIINQGSDLRTTVGEIFWLKYIFLHTPTHIYIYLYISKVRKAISW